MGSMVPERPHAVLIPFPAQGHVTPMLKLAKLLHSRGFYITFVNTHFNQNRLLRSGAISSLDSLSEFRFQSIPDGLPPTDKDATQDIPSLCDSIPKNCIPPFRDLITELNDPSSPTPAVSCIVSDGAMSFTLDVAKELRIPEVLFWTPSACGVMGYLHYQHLIERGIFPLKDASDLTNGYLETPIDWISGMKNVRLRDLPTFLRTLDSKDIMFHFCNREAQRSSMASAIILNTFDELERPVLDAMASILPPIYTIGPLSLLSRQITTSPTTSISSNLWKEDPACLEWLQGREPGSVVYVNYGSITMMTNEQLIEFAWGLANSKHDFLWVIRPDLVKGDSTVLPQEFLSETKERGLLASWCPQEAVLSHPSIGGFLTHSGWNSTLESICGGVPTISWPFFAEQQTNCRYACTEWGIGMEIDSNVKREEVERLVRELMEGEKGKEMRRRAVEWKGSAISATQPGGSSFQNFDRLVNEALL
ncbi:7-deoxyloganetin glucosyltransferase-like [Phoenix dactylifera]|uniref:Glycosyltransferase n=1 Tax=Phoenix dactylifera TaxID=42345 RepID=A0A8B7BKT4_PHODC|nr:7-deoxyloganetin glucosyltransferase-like [Phoenix dactylifera]